MGKMGKKVLLMGMLMLLWAFLAGCITTPMPRDCKISSLVIDETAFPPGTMADRLVSPLPGGPIPRTAFESAGRSFHYSRTFGIAVHNVYRYKSANRAAEEFARRIKLEFSSGEHRGPWIKPSDLTYESPIADQFHLACGMDGNFHTCVVVAQYEEYFVLLNVHMSPEAMTFQDLERLLRAIDERMAKCLDKPLPTATESKR